MLATLKNSTVAWRIRRSSLWKRLRQKSIRQAEVQFYQRLIPKSRTSCIIDIGANCGNKTEIFLNLASHIIAIEPDPLSAQTLRRRFKGKSVEVREVAVSSRVGTVPFYSFGAGSGFNTSSADWAKAMTDGTNHMFLRLPKPALFEVRTETLADIIEAEFRPITYVKIDVEGFEEVVISTLRTPVPLLSMEFNLPQMWDAMSVCIERLLKIDPGYLFNVAISEPPERFEFDPWLTGGQVAARVRSLDWRYIELYARTRSIRIKVASEPLSLAG